MGRLDHLIRVLIVEDEAIIALDLESTLADAGVAEIEVTGSFEQAAQLIAAGRFDAAVLDLHLGPDVLTYDLAKALQAHGVPFMFSSGTVSVAEAFAEVPMVMKPFSDDQIIAALLEATAQKCRIAAE